MSCSQNEAEALRALTAANARIAKLEALHEQALNECDAAHSALDSMTAARDSALDVAADIAGQRDAANARIAELEADKAALQGEVGKWYRQVAEANARAEAAELQRNGWRRAEAEMKAAKEIAESEAAALRAEVERLEAEADRSRAAAAAAVEAHRHVERLEAETENLRHALSSKEDDVERQRAELAETEEERVRHEHNAMADEQQLIEEHQKLLASEAQFAAATALLKRAEQSLSALGWRDGQPAIDIRAHLAEQPAAVTVTFEQAWAKKAAEGYQYGHDALEQVRFGWEICMAERNPTRTAAEQRVLDAMGRLDEMGLQMMAEDDDDGLWSMVAAAELARREGK